MSPFLNLHHLEALAIDRLPAALADHVVRGAGDEWTLRENRAAFERFPILPGSYRDIAVPDLATSILGERLSMPVILSPSGGHGAFHADAERATAHAARAESVLLTLSTWSTLSLEDVAQTDAPRWFQFYHPQDAGLARELLQRVRAAGYTAIVHTVDTTVPGIREANIRNGFTWPADLHHGNFPGLPQGAAFKRDLGWRDLAFVQAESGLPVIPKGIMHPRDAMQAIEQGAAGLWLSNHGGRQLDGAPSALSVLPRIARAVPSSVPIIVDGGVRRGQDIFRALALGASAVAIGRPVIYGLTVGGEAGVRSMLSCLRAELENVLQLAGVADIAQIDASCLAVAVQ